MKKYNESHPRTIVKAITFRILFTISHIVNAFIVTGSFITGLKIAGLATIINTCLFWIHERIWNILSWNRNDNKKIVFNEGNPRSLSKMISWRITVTTSNVIIPYFVTGSWGQAVLFAGIATMVNMFLFWTHERIWNLFKFGKRLLSV
jgi:uncharacterized membrane protein